MTCIPLSHSGVYSLPKSLHYLLLVNPVYIGIDRLIVRLKGIDRLIVRLKNAG
jgi:hypothetical protein